MHLHLLLEMAADAAAERVAIGSLETGLTTGELLDASRRAGAWMARQRGTTLVYVGLNGPTMPIALFGSSFAGKPFSPINYRLPDVDLRKLLTRSAPGIAVCDNDMLHRLAGLQDIDFIGVDEFHAMASTGEVPSAGDDPEQDIAVLLFTSGTTSEPKAAILRHTNLTSYVLSTLELLGAGEDEAALVSVPPYHIAGISAALTSIYSGRRMVQLSAFTPEAWVDAAQRESVTHAMVVPTMLGRILDILEQRSETLPFLRALSYGGGRMPAPVIVRAMSLLPHVEFVNAYGLTETSSTVSILGPDCHRAARDSADPEVQRRLSSVGRPLPTLELEIRDADGIAVAAGTTGEIWVRGEQVSGEYKDSKVVRDDGWFPTSDAGWLDNGGYLYVEGRLDDVIVRGGENISACMVEDVFRLHPAIDDVAVLGTPDDEWGEAIVAFVVANRATPEDEFNSFVQQRLRSTHVPAHIFFKQDLPYNETGKLLRRVLKAELVEAMAARLKPSTATV